MHEFFNLELIILKYKIFIYHVNGEPARGLILAFETTWPIYQGIFESVKNKYQQNTWILVPKSVTVSDVGMSILVVSHFENVSESADMCSVFIVKCFY